MISLSDNSKASGYILKELAMEVLVSHYYCMGKVCCPYFVNEKPDLQRGK